MEPYSEYGTDATAPVPDGELEWVISRLDRAVDDPTPVPAQPAVSYTTLRKARRMLETYAELRETSLALYEFGRCTCGKEGEDALWERLRDALALAPGHATALGVAASPTTNG